MQSLPIEPEKQVSNRYYQPGTALNRLLLEAPYLPRCSDDKTAALVRPRDYAIRHPYMQVNRQDMVSWLVFDLDHSNPLIWEEANLPAPNLIVKNRNNGHSHLFYAIAPVSDLHFSLSSFSLSSFSYLIFSHLNVSQKPFFR